MERILLYGKVVFNPSQFKMKWKLKNPTSQKNRIGPWLKKGIWVVLYLCFFFCCFFVFLYFVQIRPPPFLTPHLIRPSLAAVFWVGNLSRKPLHRAVSAYCQYHWSIYAYMMCFNNLFRILMNIQIYAMPIASRSMSAMITIYYRSIRYFSRSLSQNILQRLLQLDSQPSGATNNNILNSLNYWPRNLPVYLTISGRVIVFGTWSFTKWGKSDFARGNLSLQSTFGCNPQILFLNLRVMLKW